MLKTPLLRLAGAILFISGFVLVYFASWLAFSEIAPQIIDSGWSLKGSNLILNHDWQGNQLYLLVLIYTTAGAGLILLGRLVFLKKVEKKPMAQVQEIR